MKELLLMHDVSEEFLEVLGGFHWKDITVEEALGTPFWMRYSKEKDQLGAQEHYGAVNHQADSYRIHVCLQVRRKNSPQGRRAMDYPTVRFLSPNRDL